MTTRPTVHIIDDDGAMRDSLRVLLEARDWRTSGYASGEEFLDRAVWSVPGCLIADLRMPGMGGEGLIQELARDGDPPPTIVLTAHGTIDNAISTTRDGAVEFLEKPCSDQRLIVAIERALELDRDRVSRLSRRDELRERTQTLTPRERDILAEMVFGRTSVEIAERLGLQSKSVQVYRSRVLQKMGFSTTVELVRHLLIDDPEKWAHTG